MTRGVAEIAGAPDGAIEKHLFIICPNNSGSNVLRNALTRSQKTWHLEREGQHIKGFCGPSTRGTEARLIWASSENWLDIFCDKMAYDWQKNRRLWHQRAKAYSSDASVLVTTSPPFLLHVPAIFTEFDKPHFLFMVRNPYAVIEGICRRASQQIIPEGEDIRILAARHIVKCFEYQKDNIEQFKDCGIFVSYEKLCAEPEAIKDRITALLPEIDDLDFDQDIPVKGIYSEPLRDMNVDQIGRFSNDDIAMINLVLEQHVPLLDYFGYQLIR